MLLIEHIKNIHAVVIICNKPIALLCVSTDVCMTEEHGCDLNTSDCISGHGNIAQRCKCKDGFQTKNDVCVKGQNAHYNA